MRDYAYTIHLEPDEDGGYTVTVPALPGCVTQGDTWEEALAMAEECIAGFLEALSKAGEPIPREPDPEKSVEGFVRVPLRAIA